MWCLAGNDRALVMKLRDLINKTAEGLEGTVKIMDFCGTHEHSIVYNGIRSLMPGNVELVAGPGCPVCITPAHYVDAMIKLALDGVRAYTYGDTYLLPGSEPPGSSKPRTLADAKALGADVVVVYSLLEAIKHYKRDPKESVFLAVGFETTAPSTASAVVNKLLPEGFTLINVHRLTPPIMRYTFEKHRNAPIRGVIAPGHVSTIVGARAWEFIPREYGIPTVVAGFEASDVMQAILYILLMLKAGKPKLVNQYRRAVTWEGNVRAQKLLDECCEVVDASWRGLGFVPNSGLAFRERYRWADAIYQYGLKEVSEREWKYDLPPGCRCAEVTLGLAKPTDCPLFLKVCKPGVPYGPCMVSSEGACHIWARFGGGGLVEEVVASLGLE
ncbi:MAG: hydrogenase formation protein HypD [Desulfurococcales archaeon]|nr:hydrogenase formation protein HypD [Desulfurococcales archaeon]